MILLFPQVNVCSRKYLINAESLTTPAVSRVFFLSPVGDDQRKSDALVPLMAFGMPDFAQVLFKMQLVKTKPENDGGRAGSNTELKGPLVRYSVDFAVSPQDLRLENSANGVRHGYIEVMMVGYDPNGALLNSFQEKSQIVLDAEGVSRGDAGRIADAS